MSTQWNISQQPIGADAGTHGHTDDGSAPRVSERKQTQKADGCVSPAARVRASVGARDTSQESFGALGREEWRELPVGLGRGNSRGSGAQNEQQEKGERKSQVSPAQAVCRAQPKEGIWEDRT